MKPWREGNRDATAARAEKALTRRNERRYNSLPRRVFDTNVCGRHRQSMRKKGEMTDGQTSTRSAF
jgi:hypothetical protein